MMTQESKLLVYHSHLESHIQYGILLWGNGANNTQINRLQKIQNKALQYVTNKSNALENKKELQVLNINSMIEICQPQVWLQRCFTTFYHLLLGNCACLIVQIRHYLSSTTMTLEIRKPPTSPRMPPNSIKTASSIGDHKVS